MNSQQKKMFHSFIGHHLELEQVTDPLWCQLLTNKFPKRLQVFNLHHGQVGTLPLA